MFNFALSTSSTANIPYSVFSYTDDGHYWKNLTTKMDTFNQGGKYTPDSLLITNYITGNSFWQPISINFSSDDSANNNPNFAIRWTYIGSITSHNTRYDNFSLVGDSGALGVNEITSVNNIKIYPNPNNGKFLVVSPQSATDKTVMEVYNVLGATVYTTKLNVSSTLIDLSNNAAGVYLYKVITESGSLVGEGKLVIQK